MIYTRGPQKFRFKNTVENPSLKRCDEDLSNKIAGAKRFTESLLTAYSIHIESNVKPAFTDTFKLWRDKEISARILISTFDETLIYIYPDKRHSGAAVIDCSRLPTQITLFYDLIRLDDPRYAEALHDDIISLKLPKDKAVDIYRSTPSQINIQGPGSTYFTGEGQYDSQIQLKLLDSTRMLLLLSLEVR